MKRVVGMNTFSSMSIQMTERFSDCSVFVSLRIILLEILTLFQLFRMLLLYEKFMFLAINFLLDERPMEVDNICDSEKK